MKKTLLAVIIAFAAVLPTAGQGVHVSVLGGYSVFGSTNGFNIKDSFSGSAIIGKPVGYGRVVELSYHRQDTHLEDLVISGTTNLFDMTVEYFQIGAAQEMAPGADTTPYGLFSFGAVRYNPKDIELSDEWRFAINLGGGLKHSLNDTIGLRLSALLMMPMNLSGGDIFCGKHGCVSSAGTILMFVQAEFQAGLVCKLGS